MKKISIFLLCAGLALFAISCTSSSNETSSKTTTSEQTATYTCSMHPEVISDKPGSCPKCGMDLIIKK